MPAAWNVPAPPGRRRRAPQQRGQAERRLRAFLERLRQFTVLDPACGSGNFLYLALHALKDLEHRVQLEAEAMGLQRAFPAVGPVNVRGIEINAYAAELARVSVWIGEIQWMRRNGFNESREYEAARRRTAMSGFVLDCSVAVVRLFDGEATPEADTLLRRLKAIKD